MMKNVISIRDLSRNDLDSLIKEALDLKKKRLAGEALPPNPGEGKKVASLFFENSTRTRISSETAAENLDFYVNGFTGVEGTSVKKGEPILDTARMLEGYGYHAIIIRHNLEGTARYLADNLNVPIINSGDGSNGHPTQTLLDLMTIHEAKGTLDGLKIALVGDLKYGRTVHSLLQAFENYDIEPYLVSPPTLSMPDWRIEDFQMNTGKNVRLVSDLREVVKAVDVIYMTRIQRERFPSGPEGEIEFHRVSGIYRLNAEMLEDCKEDLMILHPLPRDKNNLEISMDVDSTPHAWYFTQAANGLYMREAILRRSFGEGFEGEKEGHEEAPATWKELTVVDGSKKGEKLVYRLDNGTLIDHIEADRGLRVCRILGLDKWKKTEVVVAMNIRSKKYGRKDVLAVHNFDLTPEQLYKVALVSENNTINLIRDKCVFKKGKVVLPTILEDLINCNNLRCVSHREHHEFAPSKFYVESQEPLKVRCHYCEQFVTRDKIELIY